eukprot:m.36852 g.36852  ORF g.36852 m.36852 type:complete len:335 (-) comp10118_c0_seq1:90-1094(-)
MNNNTDWFECDWDKDNNSKDNNDNSSNTTEDTNNLLLKRRGEDFGQGWEKEKEEDDPFANFHSQNKIDNNNINTDSTSSPSDPFSPQRLQSHFSNSDKDTLIPTLLAPPPTGFIPFKQQTKEEYLGKLESRLQHLPNSNTRQETRANIQNNNKHKMEEDRDPHFITIGDEQNSLSPSSNRLFVSHSNSINYGSDDEADFEEESEEEGDVWFSSDEEEEERHGCVLSLLRCVRVCCRWFKRRKRPKFLGRNVRRLPKSMDLAPLLEDEEEDDDEDEEVVVGTRGMSLEGHHLLLPHDEIRSRTASLRSQQSSSNNSKQRRKRKEKRRKEKETTRQ